jgi:hypothetical protein
LKEKKFKVVLSFGPLTVFYVDEVCFMSGVDISTKIYTAALISVKILIKGLASTCPD